MLLNSINSLRKYWEVEPYKRWPVWTVGWMVVFNGRPYEWFLLKRNAVAYAKGACAYFYNTYQEPSELTIRDNKGTLSSEVYIFGYKDYVQADHRVLEKEV